MIINAYLIIEIETPFHVVKRFSSETFHKIFHVHAKN